MKNAKITFVAEKKDTKVEKSVEVTPSKEFIASITDSEQELAKTEKALAYAEKQPSQKNYDEAATLVSSLSQEYEEYNDRLEKSKKQYLLMKQLQLLKNLKVKAIIKQLKISSCCPSWQRRISTTINDCSNRYR